MIKKTAYVLDPPAQAIVSVSGGGLFPVRRIFCIGRNYADHVREMGGDPKSNPPVFFTKPADAVVKTGAEIPYPPGTKNLHHEGEFVVALRHGGRDIDLDSDASRCIFGYAAGCDLTRRDLQVAAKKAGGPWDAAKAFDSSAPVGVIMPVDRLADDYLQRGRISLTVNGETRQDAALNSMIWSVPEIIIALSRLFELKAGDLIFTGTPEGVGSLNQGDRVEVRISDLPTLSFSIGADDAR